MRDSLLDFIQCISCRSEENLRFISQSLNFDDLNTKEIKEGVLICNHCFHWYPLREFIPELLPDHLRNWQVDHDFLKTQTKIIDKEIYKKIFDKTQSIVNQLTASAIDDKGINYKKSEISIKEKVTDPHFFGPGETAPFNAGNTEFTIHLIRRLGNVLPLLEINIGDFILDMGVGYAWTTEWLMKMGLNSIGIDICRTYLDIGFKRMAPMIEKGVKLPYLMVGDVENLPLKPQTVNAVLGYDAFHHIPDRKKAMAHFHRALKDTGNVVLAEPDGMHEYADISRKVMDQYGILEKGMELADIIQYCEGLKILPPQQHFILNIQSTEKNKNLSTDFIASHSYMDGNVFVIKKKMDEGHQAVEFSKFAKLKQKTKQKIKRLLKGILIKIFH